MRTNFIETESKFKIHNALSDDEALTEMGWGVGGGGALPPLAIRGCAALSGRFWKASFPKIGCGFVKFP